MRRKHVKINPGDAVFVIGIVSKLLDVPEWTLRALEKEGLIRPKRLFRKMRFYSMKDIQRIEYIHYLMEEKRVNMSGVRIILEMKNEE